MTTVLTQVVARLLFLPSLLIAIGVLIKGYSDTGDGFSAGVIAALGVGLQLMAFGAHELERLPLIQYAPIGTFVGVFLALLTAFVPAVRGDILFTHWPPAGDDAIHFGILEFITAVVFDIGVFLIVFGFGVGVIGALARAEARMFTAAESPRAVVRDHVQTGGGA